MIDQELRRLATFVAVFALVLFGCGTDDGPDRVVAAAQGAQLTQPTPVGELAQGESASTLQPGVTPSVKDIDESYPAPPPVLRQLAGPDEIACFDESGSHLVMDFFDPARALESLADRAHAWAVVGATDIKEATGDDWRIQPYLIDLNGTDVLLAGAEAKPSDIRRVHASERILGLFAAGHDQVLVVITEHSRATAYFVQSADNTWQYVGACGSRYSDAYASATPIGAGVHQENATH